MTIGDTSKTFAPLGPGVAFLESAELLATPTTPAYQLGTRFLAIHPETKLPVEVVYVKSTDALERGAVVTKGYSLGSTAAVAGSTTTSIVCAAATFVANAYQDNNLGKGDHYYAQMELTTAGAAAVGDRQGSRIIENSTTTLTLDPDYPLAEAPQNTDTFVILDNFTVREAAAEEETQYGVALTAFAANDYGFVVVCGMSAVSIDNTNINATALGEQLAYHAAGQVQGLTAGGTTAPDISGSRIVSLSAQNDASMFSGFGTIDCANLWGPFISYDN